MVSSGSRFVRIWREAGRLAQPDVVLAPGDSLTWDERFIVSRAPAASGPVEVKPLGPENYSRIADRLAPGRRPPARAAHALPSFWQGDDLIAVPSLAPFAIAPGPSLESPGCGLAVLALSAAY
jgi:tRNA(Ile)-lysidine synthase